jgi:histidine phosphotransfer protein HptB
MSEVLAEDSIDWVAFQTARAELGADFVRILSYFREDGVKSVEAIEAAMRNNNAVAMVVPAHTLKGEAAQFGAEALMALAEEIETHARHCIEWKMTPEGALPQVAKLRPIFQATMTAFDAETNPLVQRPHGFGRRAAAVDVLNQGFGRI